MHTKTAPAGCRKAKEDERSEYYIEVLATRQRSLRAKITEVGRWDESFDTLQRELEAVEHELAAIADQER